jgi:hypothetical protein
MLQKLGLVPPEVTLPDVSINVPTKDVKVVSGLTEDTCAQPITICKRINGTINFDSGADPLSSLPRTNCLETVEVGCANPPFKLKPTFTSIQVPDIAKTTISWKGLKIKPGSIVVDMSRPEFRATCKSTTAPSVPGPPGPSFQTGGIDLPFACLQPRIEKVVANP